MPILESIRGVTPASLFMIYLFLPILLVVFYRVPLALRIPTLVVASALYGLLVQPRWVPLMLFVIVFSYGICYLLQRRALSESLRRLLVGVGVLLNLGTFVFAGTMVHLRTIPMILGAAVYPFIALQGILLAYREEREPLSFWRYALECLFFPKLYAGPFTNFKDTALHEVYSAQLSVSLLCSNGGLFVRGAVKAKLIGGLLLGIYHQIKAFLPTEVSVLSSWVYIFSFGLAIYFIISGYLDMAKGIGGLFGIRYPEGFFFPYEADTITAFSRRFHTTWRRVVNSYVYRPLQGENDSKWVDSLLLVVTSMTFGIWFGFTFNYAIWGGLIGLFLVLEKYVYPNFVKTTPTFFRRAYVIIVVLISFPILTEVSVIKSVQLYVNLFSWFGGRLALFNNKILYIISSHWLLLLLGGLLAVHVGGAFLKWANKTAPKLMAIATPFFDVLLLLLLTAVLV